MALSLRLRMRSVPVWNWKDYVDELDKPVSSCSEQCGLGEERIRNLHLHRRCCWTCRPCEAEYFLPDPYGHCTECPQGQIPNKDKTSCIDLKPEYIGRNLNSPWALVPFVFSLLGILCTSAVFAIFLIYHKTPIIMASGRELCYIILIGIIFCYCFTFVVLSQPTEVSCGMLRIGMGLGLAVCYSAIFTKTNRISRIFNRNLRITRRPSYISPESQIVICLCLILIQVTLTVLWLIVKPPSMRQMLLENPRAWVVVCNYDGISVILGLSYNMVLIILCTVYAYKTRNIPENFNESKYISFTMYSSCIVWLAFVPIYCSTWQDYKVQSTILCMSVSISGTVTLACLFLPKIYIVIFRPEKNIRYPSSANNTGTGNYTTTQPVRFLRPVPNTE
ncbi:Metabotropic glutamate receptor 3, partial [Stegodyphus mimosarum]